MTAGTAAAAGAAGNHSSGGGGDNACTITQSPSSVAVMLADAGGQSKPSPPAAFEAAAGTETSTSCAGAPPGPSESSDADAAAAAASPPAAAPQDDEDVDSSSSSSSPSPSADEGTSDSYSPPPVKFRPVVVLEKDSQRSPVKAIKNADYGNGTVSPRGDVPGLPTIDEAMGPQTTKNDSKDRPPVTGSRNNRRGRQSGGSSGSGRASTGGDILLSLLDHTLNFMGCALNCARTDTTSSSGCNTGSSARSCRCGGEDVLWDGDVDDTATVNSVRPPRPSPNPSVSPRGSPNNGTHTVADLGRRVQLQMRKAAPPPRNDGDAAAAAARQAARAAARERLGSCTGTSGPYLPSSPPTVNAALAAPFDAGDLSAIVPDDASMADPASPKSAEESNKKTEEEKKKGNGDNADKLAANADNDDDDDALLSPTHFFRPVSFDLDDGSLAGSIAGSIAGSLANAIRGEGA